MPIVFIWYLVVAGPGGGMAVMPSAFDTREDCFAAIEEYKKGPVDAGWSLQCIPTASSFMESASSAALTGSVGAGLVPDSGEGAASVPIDSVGVPSGPGVSGCPAASPAGPLSAAPLGAASP